MLSLAGADLDLAGCRGEAPGADSRLGEPLGHEWELVGGERRLGSSITEENAAGGNRVLAVLQGVSHLEPEDVRDALLPEDVEALLQVARLGQQRHPATRGVAVPPDLGVPDRLVPRAGRA